ncbi:MAG: hypothetical protein AAGB32_02970 [Pseudomonadota bacterium]
MALDLNGEFNTHGLNQGDGGFTLPDETLESMGVNTGHTAWFNDSTCVPEGTDADGDPTPETTYSYTVEINFGTEEEYDAFMRHPDRDEIINSMRQGFIDAEFGGIQETLRLEISRDEGGAMPPQTIGPDSFTENTVNDLNIIGEGVYPTINSVYDINIESITFSPESNEIPGCNQGHSYGDPAQAFNSGGVPAALPKLGG